MKSSVHAFDYLAGTIDQTPCPVFVVFGDEPFLKRLVIGQLRHVILRDGNEDTPYATFEGKSVEWRDVLDELSTVSMFGSGSPRMVMVEQADAFVSANRSQLEVYVASPKRTGVLVLEVDTWQSNTRLFKAVAMSGLQIECRPPEKARGKQKVLDEDRLCKWIIQWSKDRHDTTIRRPAAQLLFELVGPQFGLLDQELAKLALFAGLGGQVTLEMVRDIVGGWRTKTTWELIDAAVEGDADKALRQLDQLLQAGEHPVALLGQISWSLRRFAAATRVYENAEKEGAKLSLRDALEQAGFRKWPPEAMENAQQQLMQLGRQRAGKLLQWLLQLDLALKGTHSSPDRARYALEELILKMSRQLSPRRGHQHAVSAN